MTQSQADNGLVLPGPIMSAGNAPDVTSPASRAAPATVSAHARRRIAELLKRHGYRLAAPQGFLISSHNTLLDGEASWAGRWDMTLGAASKAYLPAHA